MNYTRKQMKRFLRVNKTRGVNLRKAFAHYQHLRLNVSINAAIDYRNRIRGLAMNLDESSYAYNFNK